METLVQQFQDQTISSEHFQIENVVGDNSCLYRSIANGLHYRTSPGEEILDINASRIHNKDYQEVYDQKGWGLKGEIQELYSRKLQKISLNWLKKHRYHKYPEIGITYSELLESAVNIESFIVNDNYTPHGEKVVEYFTSQHGIDKGIVMLEKLWRNHFLDSMRPQFLPPLWSVDHRQDLPLDMYLTYGHNIFGNHCVPYLGVVFP